MEINFSMYDIEYFFKKNRRIFIFLLLFFLLGIVVGIIITITSDSYLSLLVSADKNYFDYVNGKVNFSKQTIKLISAPLLMNIITFLLCLNFYTGLVSFVLVSYQSSLAFLSLTAVISEYGFRGVLMSLFMILPINLIALCTCMLMVCVCFSRVYLSFKERSAFYGFDNRNFWFLILIINLTSIIIACCINIILTLILRSRIFIIF